jgi:hypothetical protein
MKVFVAFGYNPNDPRFTWIKDRVFRAIKALGFEVVTGERLQGQQHAPAIQKLIEESVGFIAFLTRRDTAASTAPGQPYNPQPDAQGNYPTHQYVVSELGLAVGAKKRLVEVRETRVDQMNVADGRQVIPYDEAERDECIVQIVETVAGWAAVPVQLVLLPEQFHKAVRPLLKDPQLSCTFTVKRADKAEPEPGEKAKILRKQAGLVIQIPRPPRDAEIAVQVTHPTGSWTSAFTRVDELIVTLEQE